jgi:hypothetical protein
VARKTKEELNKLCEKFGVKTLWSWSRINTYLTDTYEYYLKYVIRAKEDCTNGIYAVSGGYCHDILERFYSGEIKYEDMIKEYDEAVFTMELGELKFDKNDSERNEGIAHNYENCLQHFFTNHNVITNHHKLEQFITVKISDDIYCQGYIDFLFIEDYVDENGDTKKRVRIIDYKTSTKYTGKKIDAECGQLVLYSEGIRQILGLELEQITCGWNFLKYVTVFVEQKNGTLKERHIERNAIGEKLVNTAKMWLKQFGHEDDIDDHIDKMVLENSIENLPDEVRAKFQIQDCYIQVPLTDEKIQELKDKIIETVKEIGDKEKEYQATGDEKVFWQEVTDSDSFRLATLSGYSRNLHKPYDEYLKEREMFNDKSDEDADNDFSSFLDSL